MLRQRREDALGLSRREVAHRIDIDHSTMHRIEHGGVARRPTMARLGRVLRLVDGYYEQLLAGASISDLVADNEEESAQETILRGLQNETRLTATERQIVWKVYRSLIDGK